MQKFIDAEGCPAMAFNENEQLRARIDAARGSVGFDQTVARIKVPQPYSARPGRPDR